MSSSSRPKRKYTPSNSSKKNPKRGGPGVLLTCETGRERKCRIEGIEILKFYHRKVNESDNAATDDAAVEEAKVLSLDDEIKQLKTKKEKHIFSLYDTSVRGSVTLLCTLPGCALIPPYRAKQAVKVGADDDDDNKELEAKKQKTEDTEGDDDETFAKSEKPEELKEDTKEDDTKPTKEESTEPKTSVWDPVETVRKVIDDLKTGSTDAPSSRFVTRMVPIQASCFTNEGEMAHVARQLFAKYCPTERAPTGAEPITFAVQMKRRICSNMKRLDVIDLVAKEAPAEWKVDLSNPKYTLVVEIMKTLCGMSIIENIKEYGNFNLVEMRERGETKTKGKEAA
jgi:tRNA acetyltransferase TAN1